MTKMLAVTLISTAMFVFNAANAAAADRVKPGQWETKLTAGSAPPMVTKYCISAAEAALMNGDLATLRKYLEDSTAEKTKGRCSVKSVELNDNRTVVTMACGKAESVGTTTYFGDRYESVNSNGSTVVGKRLGACPKQ